MSSALNDDLAGSAKCAFLSDSTSEKLEDFYLSLHPDLRRARFCGALSNESIMQYCRSIDWQSTIIVGSWRQHVLVAVAEIHPLSPHWNSAEIILVNPHRSERLEIFAHLLQVSAFAAGAQSCTHFIISLDDIFFEILPLLKDMAEIRIEDGHASIDLADYGLVKELN